jgi:cytochrome c556
MKSASLILGLFVLCAGAVGASDAAEPTPAVIETRQQGFKKMGAAMKALVEQLKSATPDNAKMTAAVQAIAAGSPEIPNWFPAGSGPEAGVDTDALPHIWEDRAKFDSLASKLVPETKTLVTTVSGNDMSAVRTQMKAVADICSSCHKSFRAD